jgi:hypothetical protein
MLFDEPAWFSFFDCADDYVAKLGIAVPSASQDAKALHDFGASIVGNY